jgi:hypothetical protein
MRRAKTGDADKVDAATARRVQDQLLSRDMEAQSDEGVNRLLGKAQELKFLSLDINQHIKGDIDLLDDMEDDMTTAGMAMKKTLQTIKGLLEMAGGNYWCTLSIFIVLLFVGLWFILKVT